MLLSDAKLGDVVVFYCNPDWTFSYTATVIPMRGTIFAKEKSVNCPRIFIGFKEGEDRTQSAFHRGATMPAPHFDYLSNQDEFKYGELIDNPSMVVIRCVIDAAPFASPASIAPVILDTESELRRILTAPKKGNCACNIPRSSCDYHR